MRVGKLLPGTIAEISRSGPDDASKRTSLHGRSTVGAGPPAPAAGSGVVTSTWTAAGSVARRPATRSRTRSPSGDTNCRAVPAASARLARGCRASVRTIGGATSRPPTRTRRSAGRSAALGSATAAAMAAVVSVKATCVAAPCVTAVASACSATTPAARNCTTTALPPRPALATTTVRRSPGAGTSGSTPPMLSDGGLELPPPPPPLLEDAAPATKPAPQPDVAARTTLAAPHASVARNRVIGVGQCTPPW